MAGEASHASASRMWNLSNIGTSVSLQQPSQITGFWSNTFCLPTVRSIYVRVYWNCYSGSPCSVRSLDLGIVWKKYQFTLYNFPKNS